MINKNQVYSFMAMFAQKLSILSNFGEMPQVWNWVTHFDEDCQICPNKPILEYYGQQCTRMVHYD